MHSTSASTASLCQAVQLDYQGQARFRASAGSQLTRDPGAHGIYLRPWYAWLLDTPGYWLHPGPRCVRELGLLKRPRRPGRTWDEPEIIDLSEPIPQGRGRSPPPKPLDLETHPLRFQIDDFSSPRRRVGRREPRQPRPANRFRRRLCLSGGSTRPRMQPGLGCTRAGLVNRVHPGAR